MKDYDEAEGSYKFLHKDYLGSILAISDEEGNKLEQRHYDAWGNLTHLQIGDGEIITDDKIIHNSSLIIDRGYTSHEHFFEVGIIHMNGRLYDPLLRRFLNADENIQDPHNTQNYNKYGYVFNNPLMYNDPSGEFVWLPFAIAVITSLATDYYMNRPIDFINMAQNIVMSYISSGVSMGVDQVFKSASVALNLEKIGSKVMSVLANGTSGAINTLMGGGNPLKGFISSTLISAGVKGLGALTKGSNRGISIDSGGDINYEVDNIGYRILPELELAGKESWAKQIKNHYSRYYNDFSKTIELGVSMAGIAEGIYSTYGSRKYVFHNEIFRYNKNATYQWSNAFTTKMKNGQHYWSNNFVKNARNKHLSELKGFKPKGVGGGLIIADILLSGEIKPSHGINTFMLGISGTGVGSVISGGWFIADIGYGGYNYYLKGNGFITISDKLDSMVEQQYGKIELYEGLY